jgi:glycerol kinase
MQFQSDMLGIPVDRPQNVETTALGAAYLAGLAAGVWKNTAEISQNRECGRLFEPKMDFARRREFYRQWKRAVERAGGWAGR